MTVEKSRWGPHFWATIHYVALGYPDNPSASDKTNYLRFYNNLHNILPCAECCEHLRANIKKLPDIHDYMDNSARLFEWTVLLHNAVNVMLGKKEWKLDRAINHYKYGNNSRYIYPIIILLLIAVLYIGYSAKWRNICHHISKMF